MVDLSVIPHEQQHLVVCGTSLRKPRVILEPYLQSLAWQVKPRGVQFYFLFVDDGLEADARALVDEFVATHGGQVVASGQGGAPDWSDNHPVTHQWSDTAMQRVGRNKDWLLQQTIANRADAIWLCDSDLICDPMTFTDLWSIPELICAATYWTQWAKAPPEHPPVHAGPQVWQGHPYTLNGNGMEEWELRRKLIDRGIIHVYGQGACTLIRRAALEKGVSFAPMPANTGPGLMQGEDRHFCIRAEQLHLKMVASGWPDIFHIYHRPDDELLIPEMLERLRRWPTSTLYIPEHPRPRIGDLVSLEVKPLEPVGPHYGPAQNVRGRLGGLIAGKTLHPELEDAVLQMERGEQRIVPVHFDLSYIYPHYRGTRRLIRLTLIDHRPFGFQPVIEHEIFQNAAGSWLDTTLQTPELLENMREVHA